MKLLKGKKVIVTGGSSGIGLAISSLFVKNGASLAIFATSEERLKGAVGKIEKEISVPEQKVISRVCDVSRREDVTGSISSVLEDMGGLDILVNNAGITRDNLLLRMKEEDWDRLLEVNLKSVFNTCQAVLRHMIKKRGGIIINISSVIGLIGNAGQTNYSASKAGMIGFSKSLAKEVASRGIRVNCIAPGAIETKMTEALPSASREAFLKGIPMRRFGRVEDVAGVALFLASDMSEYITGQVIPVSGGMVM